MEVIYKMLFSFRFRLLISFIVIVFNRNSCVFSVVIDEQYSNLLAISIWVSISAIDPKAMYKNLIISFEE